jgi:hypothetical protein
LGAWMMATKSPSLRQSFFSSPWSISISIHPMPMETS